MKKVISLLLLFSFILCLCSCGDVANDDTTDSTTTEENDEPILDNYIHVTFDSLGKDIFCPGESAKYGYRYGPTILTNDDGSIDCFFASPGSNGEWDWITYKHSNDGGATWSDERKVLGPTPGSEDAYSTCDPGVIKIGDYYYIGYTSTENKDGIQNHLYIARSQSITGPYEKWNGRGWGGKPSPIVSFTDNAPAAWGCGEPSFVLIDDTLYIYYSWKTFENNVQINQTRVSIATIDSDNWPKNIEYKGVAMQYDNYDYDSSDIKYIDEYNMFVAVNCGGRLTKDSYITFWQSNDGLKFDKSTEVCANTQAYAHNAGISSDISGHIDLSKQVYVGYAYGEQWAFWATKLAPVTISLEQTRQETTGTNYLSSIPRNTGNKEIIGISDSQRKYVLNIDESATVNVDTVNGDFKHETLSIDQVVFSNFDTEIIDISDGVIKAKSLGNTFVTISYGDIQTEIYVVVTQ